MEQGTTKKTPHGAALSCQKMVRQLNGLYNFSAIMLARFCDEGVLCHTQAEMHSLKADQATAQQAKAQSVKLARQVIKRYICTCLGARNLKLRHIRGPNAAQLALCTYLQGAHH